MATPNRTNCEKQLNREETRQVKPRAMEEKKRGQGFLGVCVKVKVVSNLSAYTFPCDKFVSA